MKYDIATKRLLEINAKAVLQEICGIDLKAAKLIDLPQEVFTAKMINLRSIVSNGFRPQEVFTVKMIDSPFFHRDRRKGEIYPALKMGDGLERRETP